MSLESIKTRINFFISISITRLQASDTGYYTCELDNGHNILLRRSFDLRVQGIRKSLLSYYCLFVHMFIKVQVNILNSDV